MDTLSNCWVEKLPQDLASPANQQLGLAASHANSEENFTMSVFRLHWSEMGFSVRSKCRDLIPSRELTYPTFRKRKIIFKMPFLGDVLVPLRVHVFAFLLGELFVVKVCVLLRFEY